MGSARTVQIISESNAIKTVRTMAEMKRKLLKMRPTMHSTIHENMNLGLP
jgi:hypothetical protein